jgi:hypothetical protein
LRKSREEEKNKELKTDMISWMGLHIQGERVDEGNSMGGKGR